MIKRQWKNLLNAIHNENCILVLGPAVSSLEKETNFVPYSELLAKELAEEELEDDEYDSNYKHELTYISHIIDSMPDAGALYSAGVAQDFYKKKVTQPNAIHQALAQLPFHLILNTAPDDLMFKAMQSAGRYQTQLAYYNFNKEREKKTLDIPSEEKPLVYNLCGYYQDVESLVLNETQQVMFTSAIVHKQPRIPDLVTGEFTANKTYLFIGFDWEQWHLRLLLNSFKLLDLKKPNILSPKQQHYELKSKTKSFYKQSLNFNFVEKDVVAFIQELSKRYEKYVWEETDVKKVFIAADPEDKAFTDKLCKSLKILERNDEISLWHEGKMPAGAEKDSYIREKIQGADLILLLISDDFLASDTLYDREFQLALDSLQAQKAQVIPIITRSCGWQQESNLAKLHPILPQQNGEIGKPINTWQNEEDAYRNILEHVQKVL